MIGIDNARRGLGEKKGRRYRILPNFGHSEHQPSDDIEQEGETKEAWNREMETESLKFDFSH